MKKTLKVALVIIMLMALLSGHTVVLAEALNDITVEEKSTLETKETVAEEGEKNTEGEELKQEETTPNQEEIKETEKAEEENKPAEEEQPKEDSTLQKNEAGKGQENAVEQEKTESEQKEEPKQEDSVKPETEKDENLDTEKTENQALEENGEELDDSDIMPVNAPIVPEIEKGNLKLTLDLRLPQQDIDEVARELTVSLKKDGVYDKGTPKIDEKEEDGNEKEKRIIYEFNEVETGTYSLTIEGKGYQKFSQAEVEIKADTTTELHFTNGYDELIFENTSSNGQSGQQTIQQGRVGIVYIGDVDKNGEITKEDIEAIINKIEGEVNGDENHNVNDYAYDLNLDGQVDIADISYIAINYDYKNEKSYPFVGSVPKYKTNIDNTKMNVETTKGKIVPSSDGTTQSVKEILLEDNNKYITLEPSKPEEPISVENPITLELDVGEENKAKTQFLTIEPPVDKENAITEGTITVTGNNIETGEEVKIECQIGKTQVSKIKSLYKLAKKDTETINDTSKEEINTITGNAKIDEDGTVIVDFGDAIAVKRVIINVTGTTSNELADISKVEFLNGMEDKIPAPELNIPVLRKEDIDKSITEEGFTIKWNNEPNVTGYQVSITANLGGKEYTEVHDVDGHELKIEQFNGKGIKDLLKEDKTSSDYTVYYVRVRSVNGEWFSPYSEAYPVKPRPTSKPQAPTGVNVKGGYQQIKVSWNADPRATSYIVEYLEKGVDTEFKRATPVTTQYNDVTGKEETIGIKETTFTIQGLKKEKTEYTVRVFACNSLGVSDPSQTATTYTLAAQTVELPTYRRINTSLGEGKLSANIKNITYTKNDKRSMQDSPLDMGVEGSAKGVADNNFASYFKVNDWDIGGFYVGNDKGVKVEFNKPYKMNYITVAKVEWNGDLGYARVWYNDSTKGEKNETPKNMANASQVVTRTDARGNKYTLIKLQEPIYSDKIVVSVGNASTGNNQITIAEMGFYEYDDIEQRINELFKDTMHLELKDDISTEEGKKAVEAKIAELEKELNDGIAKLNGEDGERDYHLDKDALLKELETARLILENGNVGKTTKINSRITSNYDSHIEFNSGLNGFQPLGVAARAGEEITVYVGNPYKNIGDNTNLQLIATQWRAEGNFYRVISNLQVGINKVTIPEDIASMDVEKGGSLYVNYKGMDDDKPFRFADRAYSVRVSGGIDIPVLDLSSKEDMKNGNKIAMTEEERKAAVLEYVTKLETVVNSLETNHNEQCKDHWGENKYGIQDCLLGLTEIVLDPMMYSVSSKQIYDGLTEKLQEKGITNPSIQQRADTLYDSLVAMEQMMDLFYKQKGLVKEGDKQDTSKYGSKNTYPRTRQNIRCMRMTGRAFMYAGGLHIGIQWNEVKDLSKGVPMIVDSEGKEIAESQGNYFGWGIAHEIGHIINQKAYVHGEVTNNYFSILAQTDNTRDTVRFNYEDVYAKVTSGKVGKAQNVFTQLGLYWQLHLAYDIGGYNYKEYNSQAEQFENSIYARMDTYARNLDKAPTPTNNKGVALKLDSDSDNNLMRLACAGAEKNILEFFEKWGMVPNQDTIDYASQWDKDTRAIWYVNDESRNYILEKKPQISKEATTLDASITNANNNRVEDNKVNFELSVKVSGNANTNGLLGYEIIRSYRSNDEVISRAVAFVEPELNEDGTVNTNVTYTDTIDTINNRAFTYTVVAFDKYLNEIGRKELEEVKVSHSGEISQKGWEVSTNMTSEEDKSSNTVDEDTKQQVETSDFEQTISAVPVIADGKLETVFNGKVESGKAEITITLPEIKKLVGLKYTGKKFDYYEIQVSNDGNNWTTVKKVEKEANPVKRTFANIGNFVHKIANGETGTTTQTINFVQMLNGEETVNNYDYDCSYIKLIIDDTEVSISEIDLLAQSGDNVEFNEPGSIGKNTTDFVYDKTNNYSIPEGAIIFTGTYKGNPAYNVAKLWYQDENTKTETTNGWKMLNGYQIILAPDPGEADLGETRDGKWVFVVEPKEIGLDGEYVKNEDGTYKDNEDYKRIENAVGKGKVRVELYRVDDALTNEGERLVSDTLITTIPATLGNITLTSSN